MDKMVKKEIKSAFSFVKQTVKFVFFLAHLLFQTKGCLLYTSDAADEL